MLSKQARKEAYYYLGFLYEYGLGVSIDYKLALSHYEAGASLGHLEAANKVGDFYFSGTGLD